MNQSIKDPWDVNRTDQGWLGISRGLHTTHQRQVRLPNSPARVNDIYICECDSNPKYPMPPPPEEIGLAK